MKLGRTILGALALIGLPAAASAQDTPVQLRFSHWVPATHPVQKVAEEWLASIAMATGGTVTGAVFPAQQLGRAFDHYDMARDGIADVAYINPGYQPGRFPIAARAELPFQFVDAKGGSQAFDAWYRAYAATEMKDVRFCLGYIHDPGAIHSRTKKVQVPDDIKGMKIRPAGATIANFVTMLGGTNVQGSAPEVRDMLEKGVTDAVTFPWGSIVLFGADKVTKYHLEMPFYSTAQIWVLNKAKYDGMSVAQKKAVDDHCTNEWSLKVGGPWAEFEHAGIEKIRAEAGHEVYKVTPEALAQWRKAAEPLEVKWADDVKKVGGDPAAIAKNLKEQLAKFNAAY